MYLRHEPTRAASAHSAVARRASGDRGRSASEDVRVGSEGQRRNDRREPQHEDSLEAVLLDHLGQRTL